MKRIAVVIALMSSGSFAQVNTYAPPSVSGFLDTYGGDTRNPCSAPTIGHKGYFYLWKDTASKHWWYCTPSGNRFWEIGATNYQPSSNILIADRRFLSWGINVWPEYSGNYLLSIKTLSGNGNPVSMGWAEGLVVSKNLCGKNGLPGWPDIMELSPAYTGYRAGPLTDVWHPNFAGLIDQLSNPAYQTATTQPILNDFNLTNGLLDIKNNVYMLYWVLDDSDHMWGFRGTKALQSMPSWFAAVAPPFVEHLGGCWTTTPAVLGDTTVHSKQEFVNWIQANGAGEDHRVTGLTASRSGTTVTLTSGSPFPNDGFTVNDVLTVAGCSDSSFNSTAGNPVFVTDAPLGGTTVTYTQAGAGSSATGCTATQGPGYTLAALNAAWGSSYTTFGSTATAVTGESLGTGDGTTTTFSKTLAHFPVDVWSVSVYDAGTFVGADCPWFVNVNLNVASHNCASAGSLSTNVGTFYGANSQPEYLNPGPTVSTINYTTGAVSVTFNTAPAAGHAITINYNYGGWPHSIAGGTGLMDEDGCGPRANTVCGGTLAQPGNLWFPSESSLSAMINVWPGQTNIRPVWQASHTYSVGKVINDGANPEIVVACSGGCNSGSTPPAWPSSVGGTVVDNQVTWRRLSKQQYTDLINFATHFAQRFYYLETDKLRSIDPNHLIATNDWTGPWNNPYIQAQAARYCDIMLVAEPTDPATGNGPDNVSLQAMYNGTGKPVLMYGEFMASGDNPYGSGGCSGDVPNKPFCPPTQKHRGEQYIGRVNDYLNNFALQGSDGYWFIVGISLWAAVDFQGHNFGYLTVKGNAYDGVQDRIAPSVDLFGISRGGETGDYGDAITAMRCANMLWLGHCRGVLVEGVVTLSGSAVIQ